MTTVSLRGSSTAMFDRVLRTPSRSFEPYRAPRTPTQPLRVGRTICCSGGQGSDVLVHAVAQNREVGTRAIGGEIQERGVARQELEQVDLIAERDQHVFQAGF